MLIYHHFKSLIFYSQISLQTLVGTCKFILDFTVFYFFKDVKLAYYGKLKTNVRHFPVRPSQRPSCKNGI